MKVLRFLRLSGLQLGRGRLGREAAGWSRLPLAESTKSPGRLLQSPSRVLKSTGRVRLLQSPSRLSKSPRRLLGSSSQIQLLQEEPTRRWSLILATA